MLRFLYWATKENGKQINFIDERLFSEGDTIYYKGEKVDSNNRLKISYISPSTQFLPLEMWKNPPRVYHYHKSKGFTEQYKVNIIYLVQC